MWDLPRPGLEPVSPALAGGLSTTAPPGNSPSIYSYKSFKDFFFTIRALIHPEFIFRYYVSRNSILFFSIWIANFPSITYWFFSHWSALLLLSCVSMCQHESIITHILMGLFLSSIFHSFFFINLFILFIYFWLLWVFIAARGVSLVAASRGYCSFRQQAFHCGGFSCCGAWALGARASVVVARGLSSCGLWALECRLSSCGAWA